MRNILPFDIFEKIKLNINVGDTLLGGRFKNKKVKVKDIGKDENGQVTINGKPLLKFRVWKDLPKKMKDKYKIEESKSIDEIKEDIYIYLAHLTDDGFQIDIRDYSNAYPELKLLEINKLSKDNKEILFNIDEVKGEIKRCIEISEINVNAILIMYSEHGLTGQHVGRIQIDLDEFLNDNYNCSLILNIKVIFDVTH